MGRIDASLPVDSCVQELSLIRHPLYLYDDSFWIVLVTLQESMRDALSKMVLSFVDVDDGALATPMVLQKTVSPLI